MPSNESTATIARKSTLILLIKLTLTAISSVAILIVAKYMGEEVLGMIGFATALVGMFLQTDFGFSSAHNKRISEGKDIGECIGAYLKIKMIITTVLVIALLGGLFVWESLLGHGYQDPSIRPVIYIILVYFILYAFAQVPIQTFGGLRQTAKQQLPEFIGTFARMPVMIFVALTSLGIIALALSYVITGVLMVIVALFFFRKYRPKSPKKELTRSYVQFAAPLSIYIFFTTISLNIDKVIIQFFWDFAEVGNFFVMQKIILILITVSSSLGPILFPSISYYHSRKAMKYVRYLVHRAERYLSMIITPVVIVFIVLAVPIIQVFLSEGYLSGRWTLSWLSIYALLISLNTPHMHLLNGVGKSFLTMKVGVAIALTNIILLLIFVPRTLFGIEMFGMGATGAAIASTISVIVGFMLSRRYTKRIARLRMNKSLLKHWTAGFLMGLIIYFIHTNIWEIDRWYELVIGSGLALLIYLGILALMHEFRKKEFLFFLDLMNIGKMQRYVKGELKE